MGSFVSLWPRLSLWLSVGMLVVAGVVFAAADDGVPTRDWVVKLAPDSDPVEVARAVDAEYVGRVKGVRSLYRFRFSDVVVSHDADVSPLEILPMLVEPRMRANPAVIEMEHQVLRKREPRLRPVDPLYGDQWHLENYGGSSRLNRHDINVLPVWNQGITGAGRTIAIVDNGVDLSHPDLAPNYRSGFSRNYNDGTSSNGRPQRDEDNHGTPVAGIAVAARNDEGGVGVAYRSGLASIRLISDRVADGTEAAAMIWRNQEIDIYNNSWGPGMQDTVRFAGPGLTMREKLAEGVTTGRSGLGSIFVWSAGNSAEIGDNSNFDGYANSPYTIAVGAVGANGRIAGYSEPGANVWLSAPSRGDVGPGILTTDRLDGGYASGAYNRNFGGTSAAAPIVSGVAALMLEARPQLSWRDVRKILALTATKIDPMDDGWRQNGAGYWVHHRYGHGMVNAEAAVNLARIWPLLPGVQRSQTFSTGVLQTLSLNQTRRSTISVADDFFVETVQVTVDSTQGNWGDLEIRLVSPSGTVSVLAEPQTTSVAAPSGGSWTFTSVHHLDENAKGDWELNVRRTAGLSSGNWTGWNIDFYGVPGTAMTPPTGNFETKIMDPHNGPVVVDFREHLQVDSIEDWRLVSVMDPAVGFLEKLDDWRYSYRAGSQPIENDFIPFVVAHTQGGALSGVVRFRYTRNVPIPDFAVTTQGNPVDIPVLDNDFQPGLEPLVLGGFDAPRFGVVEALPLGVLRYTPNPGFRGVDRFRYWLEGNAGESWATVWIDRHADWALEFNGEDSEVRFAARPDFDFQGSFTLEAWIYPRGWGEFSSGFGRIFDKGKFSFFLNHENHAFYNDESLVFYIDSGDGFAANSPANSIRLNEWQHVVVTFNHAATVQTRFYVNGVLMNADLPLPEQRGNLPSHAGEPLMLGESAAGTRAFDGWMHSSRIWTRVLSAEEIRHFRDHGVTGGESGLLFALPLVEGSGNQVASVGFNPVQGMVSNAIWTGRNTPRMTMLRDFSIIQEDPSGWLRDRHLGWLQADAYPWILQEQRGWSRILPAGSAAWWIFEPLSDSEWYFRDQSYHPWLYHPAGNGWIHGR